MVKVIIVEKNVVSGSAPICEEEGGCVWRSKNGSDQWVCHHAAPVLAANGRSCCNFRVMGRKRTKAKAV